MTCSPEQLEDELRRRRVEWDLLPRDVQRLIAEPDAMISMDEVEVHLPRRHGLPALGA